MKTLTKKLGMAALLSLGVVAGSQATVLDSFDYDLSLSVNGATTTDSATLFGVTSTSPAGDVTYTLDLLIDANPISGVVSNAVFSTGSLIYSEGSATDATLTLNYFDADATLPIDITDAGKSKGFYFDTEFADVGFSLAITVKDAFGGVSTGTYVLDHTVAFGSPEKLYFGFNNFVGNANFAAVAAIDAVINSEPGSDLMITEVGTVPEPSTVAILGLGLLGFGLSRRRKA